MASGKHLQFLAGTGLAVFGKNVIHQFLQRCMLSLTNRKFCNAFPC